MKTFAMAAIAATISVPAMAADPEIYVDQPPVVAEQFLPWSGHVEAYGGGLHVEQGGIGNDTFWVFGGAGRANWALNDRWNVQGDVFGDYIDANPGEIYGIGGAAHVYWRDPSRFAVGGFASVTGFGQTGSPGITGYMVGPEAQAYFNNLTIYGQAFYGQLTAGGQSLDIWGGRGVARYFAQDNLRFDGEVGYRTTNNPGGSIGTLTLAAQANYRFDGSPLGVFGRYQFDRITGAGGGGTAANLHKFVVGVRASFGSSTLKEEDRNGATMDTPRQNLILF